ncbi:hypothetical protein M378DRAFT_90630 [Amanita muscaria Koide BX008]|uniref:DH domain-containing protein n=1 Tax=Amanita muscaria (strain Koide BX008) TaxID=946122 RepID=A0A0C2SNR0_AMAMK|nr:hypothetical protein M378DRAFT_90630 [Amanita muscaria Koide BX008]
MQYQDFVPISYQPDASPSDSSLDSEKNVRESKNASSRRSKLPLSPKSNIRSRRQSEICGVPFLETQLIPSLRDTIDRMTRSPSRIATPSSRETLCDPKKADSFVASESRSPSFQCNTPLPPSDSSGPSMETLGSPARLAPKALKSVLRSPKTPKTPKTVASPPAHGSPALRSVKSMLSRKLKTPPSSKNQGISSKDIFPSSTENRAFQSNMRNRSFTDPAAFASPTKFLTGDQQLHTVYHQVTSSVDNEIPTTPLTRSPLLKSSIPRPANSKKRAQIAQPDSMTEESDMELRYETESRDRRRLTVANAEVYPSSSSASGFTSSAENVGRIPPKSPNTPKQYSSLRREPKWSRKGLGLILDPSDNDNHPRIHPSLVSKGTTDTTSRSTSHDSLAPESKRRQVALLKLVSGLDAEKHDLRRNERVSTSESEYRGEAGVAISGSVQTFDKSKEGTDDDASLYEDDVEEDGQCCQKADETFDLTVGMQSNAHQSSSSKLSQDNRTHRWAIHGSPDGLLVEPLAVVNPSTPGRSPSRTPVIRRSIYDGNSTLLSPAALKRRSIYIEQLNPPLDNPSTRREHGHEKISMDDAYSEEEQTDTDQSSVMSDTADVILARARRAFGIPQSDSEKFHENSEKRIYRATLAESDFSSAGSTFWHAARDDTTNGAGELSAGATSLFSILSNPDDDRVVQQNISAYMPRSKTFLAPNPPLEQGPAETRSCRSADVSTFQIPPAGMVGSDASLSDEVTTRQRIIRELCNSEETFVARLHVCVQSFIRPLRIKNSNVWVDGVPPDIAHFLDWFEDIANLHMHHIVKTLRSVQRAARAQDNVIQCIAEPLLPLIQKLEVYQPYLVRLSSVASMVSRLVQEGGNDFGEFVAIQQRTPECGGWGLDAFLLEPTNRLTKYCDIFSRLLSSTPKSHRDYLPTFSLLQSIDVIVRVMTEVKLREDEYDMMKELLSKIQGLPPGLSLATRERRLLCQGQLYLVRESHQVNASALDPGQATSPKPTFKERAGNRMSRLASAVQAWDTQRGRSDSIKSNASSCAGLSVRSRSSPDCRFHDAGRNFPPDESLMPIQLFLFSDLALLATSISQDPVNPMFQLIDEFGLSQVFHAELETSAQENDSVPVVLDLISLDEDLKISSMRLTTLHVRLTMRKEGDHSSIQQQIDEWRSAFQRCSQATLRLLSYPMVSNGMRIPKPNHLMTPFVDSGLPIPKSPSAQAFDMESGRNCDSAQQEREKRSWWSLRFQEVLHELSKS